MRTAIRIILCAAMIAVAVTMASFTIAGFTARQANTQNSLFVLGESNGNVAVFGRDDPKTPVTVTEIEMSSLRESDRALISDGLPVNSREELAQLLEDLGS